MPNTLKSTYFTETEIFLLKVLHIKMKNSTVKPMNNTKKVIKRINNSKMS